MPRDAVRAHTPPRMPWRPLALSLAGGMALAGCPTNTTPPEPIPGYVLTLRPNVIEGADPFVAGADVSLVVVHDDDLDVTLLGTTDDNGLSLPELPLLVQGDIVGILVEAGGGSADAWDPDLTLGYGQITLDGDLPTDGGTLDLDVLVTPADSLPRLSVTEDRRLAPAVAMAPGGDVYLFGGVDPARAFDNFNTASQQIYALTDTDDGEDRFDRLDVTMPEATFTLGQVEDRYLGSTAVLVDDEDGPRILVAGGRVAYLGVDSNTDAAWLFDPEAADWVRDGDAPLALTMAAPRSGARALLLDNGDVLLYGGTRDIAVLPGAVAVYDTSRRRFSEVDLLGAGGPDYDPAAAGLGPQGALLCGGADLPQAPLDPFENPWPALATCLRLGLDQSITRVADLPVPLAQQAMVELADGQILLTGGMEDELIGQLQQSPPAATASAYVYDPGADSWRAVGSLQRPRASHAMVALPNGDALVVGGTTGVGALFGRTGPSETCWERYDASTESFVLGDCNTVGDGIYPHVASHPGDGAFVLSGHSDDYGSVSLTGAFGLMATGLP